MVVDIEPLEPLVVAPELVDGAVADTSEPYWPAELLGLVELVDGLAPAVVFVPTPALAELGAAGEVDERPP